MVSFDDLRAMRGRRAWLTFTDGQTLVVEIIDVHDDLVHNQVAFRLLEVVASGQARGRTLEAGNCYASDIGEIASVLAR